MRVAFSRVLTTSVPFRGALMVTEHLELLFRWSCSWISSCLGRWFSARSRLVRRFLARARSMTLGSISFDESRLDSHLKGGLSCHVSHLEWGLVQSVYGPFYTRTFSEVIFASFGIYPLETHWVNNKLLTQWRPFRSGIVYMLSPHQWYYLLVDLLGTHWVNNKSLTQ